MITFYDGSFMIIADDLFIEVIDIDDSIPLPHFE